MLIQFNVNTYIWHNWQTGKPTNENFQAMCNSIKIYISDLVDFLAKRDLIISLEKSVVTFLTLDTKEANINDILMKTNPIKLDMLL